MRTEHQNNATWWNETASWYRGQNELELIRSGGSTLFPAEREILGDLTPWCRRAIHLQCSHGNDALSLLHDGAGEVVGVDISEKLLSVASEKATALHANAKWVLSDILETPHSLDATADLVYTGKGAICWMMDIEEWARVVARLLKPGGKFFIYEGHPLDWVWSENADTYILDDKYGNYFSTEFRTSLFAAKTQAKPQYRQWTLAQTVNSLIDAGLTIERLMEYPQHFWGIHPRMPEEQSNRLPHTFAILARKPGQIELNSKSSGT